LRASLSLPATQARDGWLFSRIDAPTQSIPMPVRRDREGIGNGLDFVSNRQADGALCCRQRLDSRQNAQKSAAMAEPLAGEVGCYG